MTHLPPKFTQSTLPLSFLLIIALFLAFGLFTIHGLQTLANLTRRISEHPLVVSNASLQVGFDIVAMHRGMKDVVLADSADAVHNALKIVTSKEQDVYLKLDTVRLEILGAQGRNLEAQTRRLFAGWKPIRTEVVQLLEAGDRQGAIRITKEKGARYVALLEGKAQALSAYARAIGAQFMETSKTSRSNLERTTIILTLVGICMSLAIAFIAIRGVLLAARALREKNEHLQQALDEIVTLRGIIPICAYCKKIRDDQGVWNRIEEYIHAHSEADFSHGICPDCMRKNFPEHNTLQHPDKQNG